MIVRPELTVAAIIEDHGRFLFVEEIVARQLVINQPAGHVEPGESLFEAVVREVAEETAWGFAPRFMVGIYLWAHPTDKKSFLRAAVCGTCHSHDLTQELDKGIARTLWLRRDQLSGRQYRLRSPMVLRCVDDYRAGRRHPLDLIDEFNRDDLLAKAVVV